jgi:O-antigen/teichoic acid export membrane protein
VSLIAATGVTSVLGVAFWWLAAHRASLGAVGNGSAAVSAMTLVGTFGMAGLNTTLIPHLARRTRESDGLLAAGLCAAALISAVLATGFRLLATAVGGHFAPYLHTGPATLVFIGGSALTGAGLVLDEALLGLVGGTPQLWRNCAFAVTKLFALAGFTAVWHDWLGTSVLTAWVAGTAVSLGVAAALLRRRGVRLLSRPQWAALRRIGRASVRNTWLNNTLQAPVLLTPILATGLLGADEGGAFYVASTVMTVVVMLSFHFSTALYAANAADPAGLAAKLRLTLRVCLLGGVAGVPLVIVAAHPLLHVFGPQYANRATISLQIMVLGYYGSVLKNHYVALLRIYDQITKAAVFGTVTCAVRLVAVIAGARADGLVGLSAALTVVMCAEGLYTLPALRAALRGERAAAPGGAPAPVMVVTPALTAPVLAAPVLAAPVLAAPVLAAPVPAVPGAGARPAAAQARRPRAQVVYFLETHSRPGQVTRLVEVITADSPQAVVLISHDAAAPALDEARLRALGRVHVLRHRGGYGDFSHLDRYLAAVDWLDENGVDYEWLENLTGQDYPLRPIADIEAALAASDSDGLLQYGLVFPDRVPRDADRGAAGFRLCAPFDATTRYDYRHRRLGQPTAAKRRLMRPLMAINLVQPWIRVNTAYASVGVRRRHTVFGPDFACYGGSFFCTLRAGAARYVRDYARANPGVVAFFRTVLAPEETFLQSVLVNSGRFRFIPASGRYTDWSGSKYNHPKTLTQLDLEKLTASDAHWARKLDLGTDAKLFDILDQRIRRGPRTPGGCAFTGVYAAR